MNKKITLEEIEEYQNNLILAQDLSRYFTEQGVLSIDIGSILFTNERVHYSYNYERTELSKEIVKHMISTSERADVYKLSNVIDYLEEMKKAVAETTTSQQNVE
ncbi:hypothetical protein [Peptostreptococcus equinus]|uniref:Uncharacterized protein n=1 Tax=Peptostreptococcus equinus TaxID=3003601 RepID=A0ABY7JTF7_9FIRM|nr:hypothetical protein [Peptostreptococcus sp. CBA3647]WAW15255.1 hypothetical protein O0R46_02050 [Peptostreptococcus sp. CBA3647]